MQYLIKRSKAWKEIDTFKIEGQRQWIQVSTSKEKECIEFLQRLERELKQEPEKDNVYGIQLNLSCPSPAVVSIGQGAALIKRPKKVASLISELLKQNKFKVSIKTRLGLNYNEVAEKRILDLLEELEKIQNPNFKHVCIHFKHAREDSFTPYDYSLLKEMIKFNVPLVVNGGISSYDDFLKITQNAQKNIIGLMIGREALKNPDCFIEMSNDIKKTNFKKRDFELIKSEFEASCQEHMPREIYLRRIKEYCSWF